MDGSINWSILPDLKNIAFMSIQDPLAGLLKIQDSLLKNIGSVHSLFLKKPSELLIRNFISDFLLCILLNLKKVSG